MYFQLLKEKENVTWCLLSIFAMFKKSTDEMYIPSPCDLWIISCKISHIYFTVFFWNVSKNKFSRTSWKNLVKFLFNLFKEMLFCISNNNFIMIIHLTMSILHWVLMMIILELLSLWIKNVTWCFLYCHLEDLKWLTLKN